VRQLTNPEMLTLAREVRGMTQIELSILSKIDQGRISRYEGGVKQIPPDELEVIARALSFPVEFFFRDGKRNGPETGELFHRKRQSLSSAQQKRIDGLLNLLRLGVMDLLTHVEYEPAYSIPNCNPKDFDGSIDDIAAGVRASWRLPSGPIPNLVAQLEAASCFLFCFDFGTDLVDEAVQWIEPAPPIILLNNRAPGDRFRFSLAHALGHLVMHHNQVPHSEIEDEADQFASAFLMPADDIRSELAPITITHMLELKPSWKVSMQALIRRARDIGEINDRQYTSLFQSLSRYGYRKREPFPLQLEKPEAITILLNEYRQALNYSTSELAALVKLSISDFEAWYIPDPNPLRLVEKPKSLHP